MRDAKKAALAGQHIEMPTKNVFHRFLLDLVKRGEVPVAVVDDAMLRLHGGRDRLRGSPTPGPRGRAEGHCAAEERGPPR
jgi:hypothetical protein